LGLRYRLLLAPAVLIAVLAGATLWAASAAASAADRRVAHQIQAVARTLTEPPTFPLKPRVLEQMKALSGAEFLLVERGGDRVATFADPRTNLPDVPEVVLETGGEPMLGPPVQVAGDDYRGLKFPLRDPHPDRGGVLYIFYPEALRRAAVRDAVRPALLLGAGGGLAAVLLTAGTAARLVARIRAVEQRTREIAAGSFAPMPLPAADDELQDLVRSVNDMARRLADYQEAMAASERLRVLGQFSGGLAHQLRNAATGARLAVELHAKDCPAADREPLAVALRQLTRIEATLRQFLELGKPAPVVKQPCDLKAIVAEVTTASGPQCLHADVFLSVIEPDDPVPYTGDPTALSNLFGNVVGNAVDAAGSGGWVRVVGPFRSDDAIWVEVEDSGPGPPPAVAGKLFDPFVTGRDQGIGLGLAVAKQAADAYGGRITWDRRGDKTVFRIELPLTSVESGTHGHGDAA
jgi:signal transduction histidine kinase